MTGAAPPRLADYLGHIVQAIQRARRYVAAHGQSGRRHSGDSPRVAARAHTSTNL